MPLDTVSSAAPGLSLRSAWRRATPGLAAVGVFSVVINICRLATPLFVLQALDRVMSSGSIETLTMLAGLTLAALLTGLLLEILRRRVFIELGAWIERAFGVRLAHAALSRRDGGDASTNLRELGVIREFVSSSALIHWLDLIWAPVFLFAVYLIHPLIASLVLVWIAAAVAVGLIHEAMTREPRGASRAANASARGWIETAERYGETVGALGMGPRLAERWNESADERLDGSTIKRRRTAAAHCVMVFLRRALRLGVVGVGIWLALDSQLTLGGVMAASVLGRSAFGAVEKSVMKLRELMLASAAYRHVRTALEAVDDAKPSVIEARGEEPLRFDGVSHRYSGRAASVFRKLAFSVAPGESVAVLGPSASGKTTLCRIASGQIEPRDGKAMYGDLELWRMPSELAATSIGYLPQEVVLLPGTIRENIARMSLGDFDAVVEAAKLAGVHDAILRLPLGYDTPVDAERGAALSAGERKAVALARAYYGWPKLLVLDEPEPHLDRDARAALAEAIEAFKQRGTIVVTATQSRRFARSADQVIELSNESRRARLAPNARAARPAKKRERRVEPTGTAG